MWVSDVQARLNTFRTKKSQILGFTAASPVKNEDLPFFHLHPLTGSHRAGKGVMPAQPQAAGEEGDAQVCRQGTAAGDF